MLRDGRDIKKKNMKAVFGVDHQTAGELPKFEDSSCTVLMTLILFITSPI